MRVLGIESSCDETGVAIYDTNQGLMGEALYSQVELHARYGGVVPELASRDHVRKILPLIDKVLRESAAPESGPPVDAVAYTAGPGLVGALLVGASVGRALAFGWGVPALAVHHMEGHLLSPMLDENAPSFPFIALLVSGGHTQLVDVADHGQYTVLGQSLDDAVGEAFDKTAKLLGLSYPGGPELAKLAEKGDPTAFAFPRPLLRKPGLDFSFSGLKTAVMLAWKECAQSPIDRANIAASFQQAVVETLCAKVLRALKQTDREVVMVAGGVGANTALREQLAEATRNVGARTYFPPLRLCTDNGAMIAYAGWRRLVRDGLDADYSHDVRARWSLEELR